MTRAQMLAHLELTYMDVVLSISTDEYYSSFKSLMDAEDVSLEVKQDVLSHYGYMYKHKVGNFLYYHFVSMHKVEGYPELESEAFYKEPHMSTEDIMKDIGWLLNPLD
jgi:transposase